MATTREVLAREAKEAEAWAKENARSMAESGARYRRLSPWEGSVWSKTIESLLLPKDKGGYGLYPLSPIFAILAPFVDITCETAYTDVRARVGLGLQFFYKWDNRLRAFALAHEALHVANRHFQRADECGKTFEHAHRMMNLAGDMEINELLLDMGVAHSEDEDTFVFPSKWGYERSRTMEEYLASLSLDRDRLEELARMLEELQNRYGVGNAGDGGSAILTSLVLAVKALRAASPTSRVAGSLTAASLALPAARSPARASLVPVPRGMTVLVLLVLMARVPMVARSRVLRVAVTVLAASRAMVLLVSATAALVPLTKALTPARVAVLVPLVPTVEAPRAAPRLATRTLGVRVVLANSLTLRARMVPRATVRAIGPVSMCARTLGTRAGRVASPRMIVRVSASKVRPGCVAARWLTLRALAKTLRRWCVKPPTAVTAWVAARATRG